MSAIFLFLNMKLYKGFCYPGLNTVRDEILSSPFLGDGSVIVSVVATSSDLVITTDTNRVITITPPDCTSPGDSKISFEDAGQLAWLVVLVLITAFSVKVLKRGLS